MTLYVDEDWILSQKYPNCTCKLKNTKKFHFLRNVNLNIQKSDKSLWN